MANLQEFIDTRIPIIGIYKITSPTGRIYIGQTVNYYKRLNSYLNLKCNGQPRLYRSLKKYGADAHEFKMVDYCSENLLNERERYWQDFYDVLNGGLNCILIGHGENRRVITDEMRKKISDASKLRKASDTTKEKMRKAMTGKKMSQEAILKTAQASYEPVIQYDLNGVLVKEWESITKASDSTGIVTSCISRCTLGKIYRAGPFIWRKKNNSPVSLEYSLSVINKELPVLQYSKEGIFIKEWENKFSVVAELGLHLGGVSGCLTGKYKTSGGFIWISKSSDKYDLKIKFNISPKPHSPESYIKCGKTMSDNYWRKKKGVFKQMAIQFPANICA